MKSCIKVHFKPNNQYCIDWDNNKLNMVKTCKVKDYFANLFKNMILPSKGHILFFYGEHSTSLDTFNEVIFRWSEVGNNNILLPPYNLFDKSIVNDQMSYTEKIDKTIYRFSVLFDCRVTCMEISEKHKDILDVEWCIRNKRIFKHWKNLNESKKHKYMKYILEVKKNKMKNYMSKEEMMKYKIQLDC